MEKWDIETESWTPWNLCIYRHLQRLFHPTLNFYARSDGFPFWHPCLPRWIWRESAGIDPGWEWHGGLWSTWDASHFSLGTLQEKPSPLQVMRQLGWGIDREIYLVWDLQETGLTKQQQQPLPSFSFTRHIEPFTLVLCSHATPVDAVLLKSSVRGGQQPDLLGNRLLASLCCFENVF